MTLTELFTANRATTTVSSGGTTAPAGGTSESWTVASSAMFGAASTGVSQFHVADPQLPGELIAVTNVSGTTWTVTRGAENTTPVAHSAGFTVYQVVSAGWLNTVGSYPGDTILVATTGSSARAQQAADYLCTGTNDDVTINAALAALGTSPGGVVLLAEGQYNLGATGIQILGGNQHLYGLGNRAGVVISLGASTPAGITVGTSGTGNLFNNSVRHLTIDGTSGGSTANGIAASSNMFKAEDLYLANIPQDAITLSSFTTPLEFAFQRLTSIDIFQVGRDGVVTDSNIFDLICDGVTVGGTFNTTPGGRHGFNIAGSYVRLLGCRAHDMANGWGVFGQGAFFLDIVGGHFDENGQTAAAGGIHADSATRLGVTGCIFNSNDSYDIFLSSASNFTVTANRSNAAGTKGPKLAGIFVTGCTGGTVADNTLTDFNQTSARGITVTSSTQVTVHDNVILNPNNAAQQASIRLFAATNCIVHHNQVANGISEENTSNSNLIEQNYLSGGSIATVGAATVVIPYGEAPGFSGYNVAMASYGLAIATAVPQSATSSQAATNQVLYLGRATARVSATIGTLGTWIIAAGATPGTGANRLAIFNSSGTLLQQTGDMTTAFESIQFAEGAITSQAITAGTDYYLGILTSFTGTTPTFGRTTGGGTIPVLNGVYTAGFISAQSTVPTSFTPSAMTGSGASPLVYGR